MGGRGGSSHRAGGYFEKVRSFLQNAYGLNHANAIMAILSRAPVYVQELWRDYAMAFRAAANGDPDASEAYYSPGTNDVFLGIRRVAAGGSISTPYSVLYHEYGHMTDFLIAQKFGYRQRAYSDLFGGIDASGKAILSTGVRGGLLGQTAKAELEAHISRFQQRYPSFTREQAARALINETKSKFSLRDRSDISDMMEGAGIGVSHPLGAGHGLSYWRSRGNGEEIFAEITSAEAAHPGSLKAIKEYFPQTYNVYLTMLKARKK